MEDKNAAVILGAIDKLNDGIKAGIIARLLKGLDFEDIRRARKEFESCPDADGLTKEGEKAAATMKMICDFAEQFQNAGHEPQDKPLWVENRRGGMGNVGNN